MVYLAEKFMVVNLSITGDCFGGSGEELGARLEVGTGKWKRCQCL